MQDIISIYRDPIFGIIILLSIILLVAVADYYKSRASRAKKNRSLKNISKNFDHFSISNSLEDFINHTKNPIESLTQIAKTYQKAGNHEQAIMIYNTLLENIKNIEQKIEILEHLGISYYKAGFLSRAKNIFLEVLKNYPNNITILGYLMRSCENLGEFQEAKDALSCIEELQSIDKEDIKVDIKANKQYLEAIILINSYLIPNYQKQEELLKLIKIESLKPLILRYFKINFRNLFWEEIIKIDNVKNYIDLLYDLESTEVPFERIINESILDVYRAKGVIKDNREASNFNLECLRVLQKHSNQKGHLEFSYRCHSCKNIAPFYSHRCPICANIGQIELITKLVKNQDTF